LKSTSKALVKVPGISLNLAKEDFLKTRAILVKNKMQNEVVQ
jgi:hypothetical protein